MEDKNKDLKQKVSAYMKDWTVVAKKKWWIMLIELAVIAVILVADLLTKKAAWEYMTVQGVKDGFIPGLINLVMVENKGAGFGIFQGKTIALTVITFILVIGILVYLFFALKETEWLRISLVFVVGGGIGNIVDRIALGYVRDFLQFAFWEDFPVFNVADSFVTVGAFMLIVVLIVMLVKEGKKNQKEFEEQQQGAAVDAPQIDPLDAPKNLNPMLKGGGDFTFEVSEQKEKTDKADDKAKDTEADEKSDENTDKKADLKAVGGDEKGSAADGDKAKDNTSEDKQ